MKLNDDTPKLYADEGIAFRPIHIEGIIAYLHGDPDRGDALFSQITPEDEYAYIMTRGFLSQFHAFGLDFNQSLKTAESLASLYPESHKACHYLVLSLTYCQRYEEAWAIHEKTALADPRLSDHYQSACLLAGMSRFEEALNALKRGLEDDDGDYRSKVWDDPELTLLWRALPDIYDQPEIKGILADPFWIELMASYDPNARFDQLDPTNLQSFSRSEMAFITFNADRSFSLLMDWKAAESPQVYAKLYERLSLARARNWVHLRTALMLLRSEQCLDAEAKNSTDVT